MTGRTNAELLTAIEVVADSYLDRSSWSTADSQEPRNLLRVIRSIAQSRTSDP